MTQSESDMRTLDTALVAAPFAADGWQKALALLARTGGAWAGQLIGLHPDDGLVFHVEHGFSPAEMTQLERLGGYLDEVNPRIRAFAAARPHSILSEPDFVTTEERARSALYRDLLAKRDADLSCIAQLRPIGRTKVGMCVLRPQRMGDYDGHERALLQAAMPRLDAAIRLHMAVEQRGAELAARALDTLGAAAFLFDRNGRVIAISDAAAQLAHSQSFLRLKQGALTATDAACDASLQRAIHQVCRPATPLSAPHPVVLRGPSGMIAADLAPLPPDGRAFGNGAMAILVVPRMAAREKARVRIVTAFGLTAAEADITLQLSEGATLRAIAHARRASIQTVRSQLKAILAKSGARTQTQLVAMTVRLSHL